MPRPKLIRVSRICEVCGNVFQVLASALRNRPVKFCSSPCSSRGRTTPLVDRFFRYVGARTPGGCIIWTGPAIEHGYGYLRAGGAGNKRGTLASHIAYELFYGPVPDGLHVLHQCDNPPCVAPCHLFVGTNADNMADMIAKGRQSRGESHGFARLTEAKVREIRERYERGGVFQHELAREYGVSRGTVQYVVERRTWKHV